MARSLHALQIVALALPLALPFTLGACADEEPDPRATPSADDALPNVDSQADALRRGRRHACHAATCASLGLTCGTASDGCGRSLDCGACSPTPTPPPTGATPTPTPTGTTPTPTPPPASGFALGQRPFAAASSWNKVIPSNATYTALSWPASNGYNYSVNWDGYSPAVYRGTAADPLVHVSFPDNWGWPAQTIDIHLPAGVSGAVGTDGEILMLDGTLVHNCWQFVRTSSTTATCQAYGRADVLTGSGWGSRSPFLSAGIVATGSSQLAGLLVQAETDAGEIEHALQVALDGAIQKPGFSGEAISGDGYASSGVAQEGERLALPKSLAMPSGLSPLGQKVFRAMQKYGLFDIDVAGGTTTLRAQANAYDAATIDALRADVNRFMPLLQRVTF